MYRIIEFEVGFQGSFLLGWLVQHRKLKFIYVDMFQSLFTTLISKIGLY